MSHVVGSQSACQPITELVLWPPVRRPLFWLITDAVMSPRVWRRLVPNIICSVSGSHLDVDLYIRRIAITCRQSRWGLGFIYLAFSLPWGVAGHRASEQTALFCWWCHRLECETGDSSVNCKKCDRKIFLLKIWAVCVNSWIVIPSLKYWKLNWSS